jgi:dimethylglycine dehydrogenase
MQHLSHDVHVRNVSDRRTGFQIAGPNARDLLTASTREDVAAIKFLDVRRMTVGQVDCTVQRVSYTGDLGYEIYCDPMDQRQLWWTLWNAGQPLGITPFGMRAMMSLRLDRHFGSWLSEFSPDYTAAETGMDRFISFKKNGDFIGRAVAEAERATPPARVLVVFEVDAEDADVVAYEPVFIDGTVQGFCTSGGYSHHTGKSIAMALIPREHAHIGKQVEIEIMGKLRSAVQIEPTFDRQGSKMRS